MAEQKVSRKAQKTKKKIGTVLAELLQDKELRDITVQEIADKADVSRTTIYNYYMDVYDIYEQLENTVLTELGLLITEHGVKETFEVYQVVFDYIRDNPVIFKMVFGPKGPGSLYMKLLHLVEGLNQMIWSESFGVDMNDDRVMCAIRYHSNGTLAIVGGWVMSDFRQPADFVIQILTGLDKSTQTYLASLLG
jgi:AcrR family transcriptional regulator